MVLTEPHTSLDPVEVPLRKFWLEFDLDLSKLGRLDSELGDVGVNFVLKDVTNW